MVLKKIDAWACLSFQLQHTVHKDNIDTWIGNYSFYWCWNKKCQHVWTMEKKLPTSKVTVLCKQEKWLTMSHTGCGSPCWMSPAELNMCAPISVSGFLPWSFPSLICCSEYSATSPSHDLLEVWHSGAVLRGQCVISIGADICQNSSLEDWGLKMQCHLLEQQNRDQTSWWVSLLVTVTEYSFFDNWKYFTVFCVVMECL